METNLLPIGQTINAAKNVGVTFGHGDPKVHLAYLTKLRLLPQTIRRKWGNKITGCYPSTVVETLKKIEVLKNQGLPYSQIRYMLNQKPANVVPATLPATNSPAVAFLLIGLVLGYILASLPKQAFTPSAVINAPEADVTSAQKGLVLSTGIDSEPQPIYLIVIPDKNLYKLGKISL